MTRYVELSNVSKHYGKTRAVDDVTLTVSAGEIVGLIGANGAGKSTLLKTVLGLIRCEGEVRVFGEKPTHRRNRILESLSYVADVASLPEWISVSRLVDFLSGIHPNFDRSRALSYLDKTDISLKHRVKALSKGMKTQLHLAMIMGVDSDLLVLDEPTLGLDVIFRTEFYDTLVRDYFREDRSIIVTTHQVEEIEDYLTRVVFIKKGRIVLDTPIGEVATRYSRVRLTDDTKTLIGALEPLYRRKSPNGTVMVFDHHGRDADKDRAELSALGDVDAPGLTDLFVATVQSDRNAAVDTEAST